MTEIKLSSEKRFTQINIKFLVAMLFSILVSVIIALQADMPDSIGFGGFTYIIEPALIGLLSMLFYSIFSIRIPSKKIILGVIGIVFNICIGFYYMLFV